MSKDRANKSNPVNEKNNQKNLFREKILTYLHQHYVNQTNGLLEIGKKLGLHLFAPRRKVNVLIMGNHSSGKSSFINWYVNQKIVKTGVAIETQGFTFVARGKSRETVSGKATLHLYPYLKPLESIGSVLNYVTTELYPTGENLNLITLIDSPGLADGALHYPFDIERSFTCLSDIADLIFIFFDPIGQALCKRTLNIVEKMANLHPDKMRFYLSKADEAGEESDRQKVMMQIVQELCKRPCLNQCGFEMSTIFIPNHSDLKIREKMCTNQINNTCEEIDKAIAMKIQNTFKKMEKDLQQLQELAQDRIKTNQSNFMYNLKMGFRAAFFMLLLLIFPLSLSYQHSTKNPNEITQLLHFIAQLQLFFFPAEKAILMSWGTALFVLFVSRYYINFKGTNMGKQNELKRIATILEEKRQQREKLFADYLNQMVYDVELN